MKTFNKAMSLFGDFYFESSTQTIESYYQELKKYSFEEIHDTLKRLMQDILANLLGWRSFNDAVMCKRNNYSCNLVNFMLGKRKLAEFLSLLNCLDKDSNYVDKITFVDNENDEFLKKVSSSKKSYYYINLNSLSFTNLDEFFDLVINICEKRLIMSHHHNVDSLIPDPTNFDLHKKYYKSIDSMQYIKPAYSKELMEKKEIGKEVELREYIRNYQERYQVRKNIEIKFSEDETKILKEKIKEYEEEIADLKERLRETRSLVVYALNSSNISLTNEDIDKIEDEIILEQVINKANLKIKFKKSMKTILYMGALLSILTLKGDFLERKASVSAPASIGFISEAINEDVIIPDITKEDIVREFKIGETIDEGVNYYSSSTDIEPLGKTNQKGLIIGYFAVKFNGSENVLIKGCRTQREMAEFLLEYDGETSDIFFRTAICTLDDPEVLKMIENGEEVPYTYTSCYVDYEYEKEMKKRYK